MRCTMQIPHDIPNSQFIAPRKQQDDADFPLAIPAAVVVNETGKWPEIVGYHWHPIEDAA